MPDDFVDDLLNGELRLRLDPAPLLPVRCDACGKDFSQLPDSGGIFWFDERLIGPCCAARWERVAGNFASVDELITARCPAGKSFADWVREEVR